MSDLIPISHTLPIASHAPLPSSMKNLNLEGSSKEHEAVQQQWPSKMAPLDKTKVASKEREHPNQPWSLGMIHAQVEDPHDPEAFRQTLAKITGSQLDLSLLTQPTQRSQEARLASLAARRIPAGKSLFAQGAEAVRQRQSLPSQVKDKKASAPMDSDPLALTEAQGELAHKLAHLPSLRLEPNLELLGVQLSADNLKAFKDEMARSIHDAKDVSVNQKKLNEHRIDDFTKQVNDNAEQIKKQMKSPIARIFMGIGKIIMGVIKMVINRNPMELVNGCLSAATDFIKSGLKNNLSNYGQVLQKLSKLTKVMSAPWMTALSAGFAIAGAVASMGVGAVKKMVQGAAKGVVKGAQKSVKVVQSTIKGIVKKEMRAGEKMGVVTRAGRQLTKGIKALKNSVVKKSQNFKQEIEARANAMKQLKKMGLKEIAQASKIKLLQTITSRQGVKGLLSTASEGGDLTVRNVDQYQTTRTQSQLQNISQTHESFQDEVATRYEQLNQQNQQLTDILAQEKMKLSSDALDQGSDLLKQAFDQKSQLFNHRI